MGELDDDVLMVEAVAAATDLAARIQSRSPSAVQAILALTDRRGPRSD